MFTTLLRHLRGLPLLVLALLCLAGVQQARATHLYGGEMSYRYLDANGPVGNPFRYEVTTSIYNNRSSMALRTTIEVGFYYKNGTRIVLPANMPVPPGSSVSVANPQIPGSMGGNILVNITTQDNVSRNIPAACNTPGQTFVPPQVDLVRYVTIVCLPVSIDGYLAYYSDNARTNPITNLQSINGSTGNMTLYLDMAGPLIPNSAPVFSDTAVALVCRNDTTFILNSATDADGDRLTYSFGTPYAGNSAPGAAPPGTFPQPIPTVSYATGYSTAQPFGAGSVALLNASTGLSTYVARVPSVGFYVVAVDVNEYRNINGTEVLIGRTRRDIQLAVRDCPAGNAPTVQNGAASGGTGGTGGSKSYTVEEGQTLTFPITTNTNPGGNALTTRINSSLLDGSGSINAAYNGDQGLRPAGSTTGTVTVAGSGPTVGTFSFTPSCGMARSTTYDVLATATVLCTTKSKSEVFQITVTKAAAPTAIAGPTQICDVATVRSYTATGTSPSYNWHVVGGTIVGGQGTGTVQVRWNSAATTAQLSLKGISAFGCRTDSIVQSVTIRPLANPVVTPSAPSICRGASTTLTVTPVPGLTYTIAGGAQTVTGTTLTVSPTATTVYTVTATDGTCSSTSQVTVTVVSPPAVSPGTGVTICSGQSVQLGAAPVAGLTYLWSPSTGLNDPTLANPTVTGVNTTGANITLTYTLTVTNTAGCVSTGTVTVTVTPPLVVSAGTPADFCSGGSAQLGAAPVAGVTYSWSPTTGLSNANIANPTVTLTNATGATQTFTYTLTATTTAGCVSTATVAVTVRPGISTPAVGPRYLCSGETVTLAGPPGTGYTYSWSPTTGLSDPTSANPVLTGSNTTAAPITTTYTVTVTNPQGCTGTMMFNITVAPLPTANAGANQTLCSGATSAPLGVAAVSGNTYRWTPATGLSDPTAAQPTATLTNTGTSAITQTYTLTVTGPFVGIPGVDGTNCSATSTVTLTVSPTPVAIPGPYVDFCSGGSALLGAPPVAGNTYSWSPTTGLSDPTSANPTVTGTNTTNAPVSTIYILTVTNADNCTATGRVIVTINPAVTALPGADRDVCSGLGTQLGAAPVAGNTYSWSPATGLNNATVANPTATLTNTTGADITQTYTLTTTNSQGCSATGTVTVTVKSAAVADAGPDLTECSGATGLVGTPGLPGYTYNWITTPQSGIVLNNNSLAQPTFTVTNTTQASFFRILVLQVTAPNGCTGQDQVQITINPAAVAEAGPDYTTCPGQPVTLGPLTNPVTPGTTYAWTPATGLSSTTVMNPVATLPNTTGAAITQKYYLTVTTSDGCSARDSVTVTVTPGAVVDAGANQTVCADQRIALGTPAQAGYTYTWTPATGLSSTSAAQPLLNTAGLNTTQGPITLKYYLDARTTNGCAGRDSVEVTINPRPASTAIIGSPSVCPTVTGVTYSTVTPGGSGFQWLVTGGTIASGQGTTTITVDWGAAGNGLVQLFQLNAQGCSSDTTDFPVRINPILQTATPDGPGNVTAAAPNNAVCQGNGPYTYTSAPYTNGSVYAWTIIGGTQVSTNLNTVTVQWNPVTVPTVGKIVVTETSNPASGIRCLGTSDTLRVNINPTPLGTLALSGPARVCQGSPISFTLPGGFAGSTYAFLLDGAAQTSTGNTLNLPAQTSPGTYTVSVRETSAQGCAGPLLTTSFTVDPTPGAATITGPAFVCDLTQALTYSVPNTPGATYQWTVTGALNGTFTGQGSSQITVQFDPAATSYSVSVIETSAFGCAGPAATLRVLPNNPSLSLALASVAETSNNNVVLTLSVPNGANTSNAVQIMRRVAGQGSFVAIGTVPATATTYTDATADAAANSYEYQLELTNGCGTLLQSAVSQTIRLQATATVGVGGRDQGSVALSWNAYVGFPVQEYRVYRIVDGGTPELLSTVPAGTRTATVPNGATGSAIGAGFNQVFRVVAVGSGATALLSNSNTSAVDFSNAVATYNIITPNGDGLNDVLVFDNITLYPGNSLTIYNRWGREVYNTTNYKNTWGGENLSGGTYYYLLKLPNGSSTKSWFEIVK